MKKKGGNAREVIHRGPFFMPSIFQTNLRYSKEITMFNAVSGWSNIRFSMTNAYDIDPTLGSTSMPGFTELGTIYRFYRVKASSITVCFSNVDVQPGTVAICPVNFDPTANTASFQQYLSQTICRKRPIGPLTGNGIATIHHRVSTAGFAGALSRSLDPYVGSTAGTPPTNNIFWLVGAYLAAIQTTGVYVSVSVNCTIEFFELSTPPS